MGEPTAFLRCARVEFTLRFLGEGVVSRYWPNTLRGGFGVALRETSCVMKRDTAVSVPCGGNVLTDTCLRRQSWTPTPSCVCIRRRPTPS